VIIKADGLPGGLVQRMIAEKNPASGKPLLPWFDYIFVQRGVRVQNFYSRGVSLSVPAWSILDTGRPMAIRGNVEYDRYTLRAFDYLNFVPFYFKFAFSKTIDMPGVEVLDDLGIALLADRFSPEHRRMSFQLYQRGIRWSTLQRAARKPFSITSPRELLDEWHAGFELSRALHEETERDLIRALEDPEILYLDLFTGDFDHVAHLDNSEKAQREVVLALDHMLGRIWSAIEKGPLAAQTLLVLVSDHGMNTAPGTYSQGFNLVELLRSAAGGGHHVVTNRHPLSEYKLRGLYPFVHKVYTASESSPYGAASPKEYPTALLDLDGNERAGIYLRNSGLNVIHLLLIQLKRRDLPAPLRRAALIACRQAISRYAEQSRPHRDRLRSALESLRASIAHTESQISSLEKGPATRRLRARASSWRTDEAAYTEALAAIDRLVSGGFGTRPDAASLVPKRMIGENNSIHQLQNYPVSISREGLQLAPDGTLDQNRSFRRIDYFALLSGLSVRNVVQEGVGGRPVDFIAVSVPPNALPAALSADRPLAYGVWLYGDEERQLLILVRDDPVQIRVIPVARLRQDEDGRVVFEEQAWRPGLPLAFVEDEDFGVGDAERIQWLSGWHPEREWLRVSHASRYSNAVIGLYEHFRPAALADASRESFHWVRRDQVQADLLVLARDHWNFNVRGFNAGGNHGSFFRISTHGVLMMSGGEATGLNNGVVIDEPYDSLSFVPTLLALMGRCEPDLPGALIHQAGPMACAAK
jgi:hypothetical protein